MDPVSIVGLASSIGQLIQLSMSIVNYVNKVVTAPKERKALTLEIVSLVGVLLSLKQRADAAKTEQDPWFAALSSLGGEQGSLQQLRSTLEFLGRKLEPRIGRNLIWAFSETEIRDTLARIERVKSLMVLVLQDSHMAVSQATRETVGGVELGVMELQTDVASIEAGIQGIAVGVMSLHDNLRDELRRNIARWLSPLNFLGRQDEIFRRRQEGTDQWLLDSPEFKDWVSGANKLLRCSGIPGSGKTTIVSVVVEHLKAHFKVGRVGVLVIYCNYKEQAEQTVTNLIASLLKQLLQSGDVVPEDLVLLYHRHSNRDTRPSLQDLSKILKNMISSYDKVYIIADALDESTEVMGVRLELTSELLQFRSSKCNMMITARNYAGLETIFENDTSIEVTATNEDVLMYVNARISQANRLARHAKSHPGLLDEIRETVTGKANGMFLLARLHMDSLENKTTAKAVRAALHGLPTSLNASYDEAMERISYQSSEDRDLALRVLSWITNTKRALTILELRHALAVEEEEHDLDEDNLTDEDIIISVCCGLITIDQATSTVRLVHYTLHTYFETTRKERFPEADTSIANTCLAYLLFDALGGKPCDNDSGLERRLQDHPFLLYAAQHWGDHARGGSQNVLKDRILDLLNQEDRLASCTQIMGTPDYLYNGYSQAFPRQPDALWVASSFGLVEISRVQLQSGCDVNTIDSFQGHTPLYQVAEKGYVELAKLLLDHGAIVDVPESTYGFTPLRVAAQNGYEKLVGVLIEAGADIYARAEDGKQTLHGAASKGWVPILRLLLDNGADVNVRDSASNTPLHIAASSGHESATAFLLDNSAALEAQDMGGRTALNLAAVNGHNSTTRILLQRGANPNARDRDSCTPIMNTTSAGQTATLVTLLENGADVNARDMRGRTALDNAVFNGKQDILSVLLQWGADVQSRDEDGWTALHRAAWNGDVSMVTLLLEHRADVNAVDSRGETVLQQAAWMGHADVVHLLLEAGTAINNTSLDGQTAVHRAAGNGRTEVVVELIARGADPYMVDKYGATAAELAKENHHDAVVQLLSIVKPGDYEPPTPRADWVVVEKAHSADQKSSIPNKQTNEANNVKVAGPDPEILEANAKLSDPAVFESLSLDPEKTKIELFGPLGFSMKATIFTEVDGEPQKYFMKTRFNEPTDDLYLGEYLSLEGMHATCPSITPAPLAHGNLASSVGCFLVTEFLDRDNTGKASGASLSLAQKLSQLHSASASIPEGCSSPVFGFPAVTYCGPTPQPNDYCTSWHDFFVEHRMRMILRTCEVYQGLDHELRYWVERTIAGPIGHLLADGHLGGSKGIAPALVHGNLWHGNKMRGAIWGTSGVEDVLFDPSSCWCHSEFEMGILRLFGGFSAGFFQEYHRLLPKTEPVHEYEDRVSLYQLYHQLNHHAIFGEGYRAESIERMRKLCDNYPVK